MTADGDTQGPEALGRRLRDRKIFQWALAYLGAAWLLLQVLDVLADVLAVPIGAQRILVILVTFGLPVTLVLAWYHGEAGRQRVSGAELLIIGLLTVLAGSSIFAVRQSGAVPGDGSAEAAPAGESRDRATTTAADLEEGEAPDDRSIAVLPFVDLSEGHDQEYFADGMTEELLAALSQVEALRVAARTSSFAFKDSGLDVSEIGRRIGVATVVEGSVRRSENRLRITAQLVDTETGFRLWSETYDRQLVDVFEVQEELAHSIAVALRFELSPAALAVPGQTSSHEAQDAYLQGRFFWHRRTQQSLESAVDHFQRAIDLDPEYARAYVGLGDANAVLGFYDYRPPSKAFPAARRSAERALEIEPSIAEAHATLGYVAVYYDWDWEASEREFLRAIELDPEYSVAHQWYANFLVAMGRWDEALAEMRRSSELDPLSLIANAAVGWVLLNQGENELAVAQLNGTVAMDSEFQLAYLWRGQAHEATGELDRALADLQRAAELSDRSAITLTALSHAYATAGRRDEAGRLLDEVLGAEPDRYVPSYEIARAYVGLGDHAAAVRWLERAFEDRAHSMAFLRIDPQLAPLGHDPGYRELLARMRLDDR